VDTYTRTRTSLHAVAEGILAGPQFERSGTVRLRALQGGFATVAEPALRVAGTDLVTADGRRVELAGTYAAAARAAGVTFTVPAIYSDHAPVDAGDEIELDTRAAADVAAWFEQGRQALVAFAPGEQPVLWPEHFDLAITLREVNYGVSPGDGFSAEPYAYVGPWSFDADSSPFWNAPFGAMRTRRELPTPDSLTRFFRNGQEQAARARS
jgi:hypothetical protein